MPPNYRAAASGVNALTASFYEPVESQRTRSYFCNERMKLGRGVSG